MARDLHRAIHMTQEGRLEGCGLNELEFNCVGYRGLDDSPGPGKLWQFLWNWYKAPCFGGRLVCTSQDIAVGGGSTGLLDKRIDVLELLWCKRCSTTRNEQPFAIEAHKNHRQSQCGSRSGDYSKHCKW